MRTFLYKLFLIVIAVSLGLISALANPEPVYAQNMVTKEKDGLKFSVSAEDWPIEKRNGIIGPIPTEEYMVMKFGKTDEAMDRMKREYEDRIKALEEKIAQLEKKLKQQMDDAARDEEISDGIEVRLKELENRLKQPDQKAAEDTKAK